MSLLRRDRTSRAAAFTAATLMAGALLPLTLQGAAHAATAPDGGDVIANLFEWNWPSVANECTTVLGPKGYGAVQVAPPEDSIRLAGSTHAWWDVYQPVAYDLNSRMGTEAQFAQMVTACHNAGVKVYADAVLNHTAGANQTSTDSYGGASFNPATFSYGSAGYTSSDFHFSPPCPNADMSISDWNNVTQVQDCDLSSLSDLATERDDVRAELAGYLNKLVGYGVDGFRMDAAKHIAQADMANILGRVNNTSWTGSRPYVYQEVIPGSSGQLAPAAFEGNGSVIEFTYAYDLKSQFEGSIANLKTFGQSWGIEPSAESSVMVANHDTERSGQTLSYKDGSKYTLATLFELAWGYGTPQVYSGFDFSTSDQSPPADQNGYVTATDCSSGAWICTDRNQGIAAMVAWHNAAQGKPVANWWDNGGNAIAFSRGNAAWISINNGTSAVTQTFTTGLPAGTYCDIIHGTPSAGGGCSGPTVAVNATGQATVTVNAGDAVALYPTAPVGGTVGETFNETRTTSWGQNVYVVGSIPALGSWNPSAAIPLSSANYPVWGGTVSLPANTAFQYKYLIKDSSGNVTWENGGNHSAGSGTSGGTLNDTWQQ
ncbi:alpha-amylase family glycosyl hydrolase [Kitasatospora sp. NBC_01287]|uniref:carbohydrate-binding module family 20 domain-containing protein n=1 Tax=Kitasatospora sp. NBC_01287 TaxID=2903573 RepID=UPI0022502F65|nr:carbohydrate-binding module family 20 domain-containing protein [Kitasatospora sp. NBC_01287]MCX4748628.1 alpha-amylase family glycosyl hydrolase [Kitasatospora sp. NBC_01287]